MVAFINNCERARVLALMNVVYFIKDDINQATNNFRSVRGGVLSFIMNQIKISLKVLILSRIKSDHLLARFFKEVKLVKVINVHLPFKEYFLPEEKYFSIIAFSQVCKFPDCRWSYGEYCWSLRLVNKQVRL